MSLRLEDPAKVRQCGDRDGQVEQRNEEEEERGDLYREVVALAEITGDPGPVQTG